MPFKVLSSEQVSRVIGAVNFPCLMSEGATFRPFVYIQNMSNGGCIHNSAGFNLANMFTRKCKDALPLY